MRPHAEALGRFALVADTVWRILGFRNILLQLLEDLRRYVVFVEGLQPINELGVVQHLFR